MMSNERNMKTIEERLKEIHENESRTGHYKATSCCVNHFDYGYIQGATEQKAIDIEKAYRWLREYTSEYFVDDYDLEDKFLEDFRKAMEE